MNKDFSNAALQKPSPGELIEAVMRNDIDRVADLLQRKADVNEIYCAKEGTALIIAAGRGFSEIVTLLIAHHADLDSKNDWGFTALHSAVCGGGYMDIVRQLVTAKASLDETNEDGNTALITTADNGNAEIAAFLARSGADPNIKGAYGWTSLTAAAYNGNTEIAGALIDCGAVIDVKDDDGSTPLMCAAENNCAATVKLLLQRGASLDETNDEGKTVMDIVMENDALGEIRTVLQEAIDAPRRAETARISALHATAVKKRKALEARAPVVTIRPAS